MLTLPLAQSDNMLPASQKVGKLRRFRMSQGFIEESGTWNVFNWSILRMITASYCRGYKLTIVNLKWVIDSLMEWCLW